MEITIAQVTNGYIVYLDSAERHVFHSLNDAVECLKENFGCVTEPSHDALYSEPYYPENVEIG